jgi:putative transposase
VIEQMKKAFPTKLLCELADVPRSSYYAWAKSRKTVDLEREHHRLVVKEIHETTKKSYGSRRMSEELKRRGFDVGRYQARSLMRESNLVAEVPRPRHKYPVDSTESTIAPNLLNREFEVDRPNTVWVGDITYIRTQVGWLYLAVVMDLYSRRIVGWRFSTSPDTALTTGALRMAIVSRQPLNELLFHTDQGCQYTSSDFQKFCKDAKIEQSMSRRGNCWDNAVAERFFRSLKSERIRGTVYQTNADAKQDVLDYILRFYNPVRLHSANGNLPPVEYERMKQAA